MDASDSEWPHPPGTWVRCVRDSGYALRFACEEHVFEIISEPQQVDWGCGYVQMARCLVCDWTTTPTDAETFAKVATEEDIVRCYNSVHEEVIRLERVMNHLMKREKPVLRDFG